MAEQHVTFSRYARAWDEFIPECSCGWVGSYVLTKSAADKQAAEHVEQTTPTPPGGDRWSETKECLIVCISTDDEGRGYWCEWCPELTCPTPPGQ